jgi:hypothetical protein
MNTKPDPGATPGNKDQRDKLEESMEKSTAKQPETFRDDANQDKVVEIGPDKTKAPIHGIDAPERKGR